MHGAELRIWMLDTFSRVLFPSSVVHTARAWLASGCACKWYVLMHSHINILSLI